MKLIATYFVEGLPATQGSKKHVGGGRIIDSCKRLPEWRKAVSMMARQAYRGKPVEGRRVDLGFEFVLPRPKSHYGTGRNQWIMKPTAPRYPIGKPDLIKMTRSVEDAMSGIVYHDDSQVCEYVCLGKRYSEVGEKIGVNVDVYVKE